VEASLLPSKEIAALAAQVTLVVVRKADPRCAELRKEFGVPYLNSWVVVLDGRGETLASWIGDAAGAGCMKSETARFPRKMVALIRRSLRITESLQQLARRWQTDPSNMAVFESYARRLQQMNAFDRLQQICHAQAKNPQLKEEQRNDFRVREYLARGYGHGRDLHTGRGRTRFALQGEKLLVELADHPKASELPQALFGFVYAHGFDVPARSADAIARLEKTSSKLPNPSPAKVRIAQLERIVRDWIKEMERLLPKAKNTMQKQFIAASLGDAHAAIDLFSQPGYKDVPEYGERLRAARRKLRQRHDQRG
jgi:hypothetical protein